MTTRRDFLRTASLFGSAALLGLDRVWGHSYSSQYFGLHAFVENNADAVFILRTAVDTKTNTAAIRQVGRRLGEGLFVAKSDPTNAYPVGTNVVLKPNITSWAWDKQPIEQTMGIQTDPYFVEGIVDSLVGLSIPVDEIYIREANYSALKADGKWYSDLAQRTGLNLVELPTVDRLPAPSVQWLEVPDGIWYKRIPYLWPVNSPGSCLVNIAKFKSHSMGMTLCSKNLQGTNARPYVAHCTRWGAAMSGVNTNDVVPGAFTTIKTNYERHKAAGIPRWATLADDPAAGSSGGLWQETHATRCLDNNSVTRPLLNIIEGIYGREGPFVSGPEDNNWYGRDILTNLVVFGKNARHVDIIGTYLAGHEPGDFGLFHLARERGLSKFLDPADIPLFEWSLEGTAVPAALGDFSREHIRTIYLPQSGESTYHMVDHPYDYSGVSGISMQPVPAGRPDAFALSQNFPNPFNPTTSIQFTIPRAGHARLEVFDLRGEVVDVLVDGSTSAGDHLVVWHTDRRPSGTYFYRLSFDGMHTTKAMLLVR